MTTDLCSILALFITFAICAVCSNVPLSLGKNPFWILCSMKIILSAFDNNNTLYFKLPYLPFSNFSHRKVRTLIKRYCSNLTIKLAFSSFKIKNLMKMEDSVPRSLRSCVVYKFTCAGCNSVYVGETCRHISTRVREHLFTDKSSHIYKHLQSSKTCKDSCDESCFKVIDLAKTYNQLKFKEALHILWEGHNLNKQVQHYNFSLSF